MTGKGAKISLQAVDDIYSAAHLEQLGNFLEVDDFLLNPYALVEGDSDLKGLQEELHVSYCKHFVLKIELIARSVKLNLYKH